MPSFFCLQDDRGALQSRLARRSTVARRLDFDNCDEGFPLLSRADVSAGAYSSQATQWNRSASRPPASQGNLFRQPAPPLPLASWPGSPSQPPQLSPASLQLQRQLRATLESMVASSGGAESQPQAAAAAGVSAFHPRGFRPASAGSGVAAAAMQQPGSSAGRSYQGGLD